MHRDPYPIHGRTRRWFRPFTVICRCGLDAYPCPVTRALAAQGIDVTALRAPEVRVEHGGEWRGFQW
jgi:hypothetical protein